jgi:hypothetical protein
VGFSIVRNVVAFALGQRDDARASVARRRTRAAGTVDRDR